MAFSTGSVFQGLRADLEGQVASFGNWGYTDIIFIFHRTGSARVFIVSVICPTYAAVFIPYRAILPGKPRVSEGIWPHDLFPL